MRLTYSTKAEAQIRADSIHAALIATDKLYAESVNAGHTKQWAIPYQDTDEAGKPINTEWHIVVNNQARGVMTAAEVALFPEWSVENV